MSKFRKPPNKAFYTSLICFWALIALCSLLQGILRLIVGANFFYLDSYIPWFFVTYAVALAGVILLLRYYHFRKYRFAFYTYLFAVAAGLWYAFVIYNMLVSRELYNYYFPALMLSLLLGIPYAISLIVSPAGKKDG